VQPAPFCAKPNFLASNHPINAKTAYLTRFDDRIVVSLLLLVVSN
jgi:hypothetical protein